MPEKETNMHREILEKTSELTLALGLDESPMGLHYTNTSPDNAFSPRETDTPTREKETAGQIDWPAVFGNFSCALGHIWRARRKHSAAAFSARRFGCPGGAFWLGFLKPQAETIIHYVSTGVPGQLPGECYCDSPDAIRGIFEYVDPRPAPAEWCVVKPLDRFAENETPELVIHFARPESLCGLHQLATFVTGDPEVVAAPFSAACGSLAAWPLHYLQKGRTRAVVGGLDPSARKFFKTDELSFTVPWDMHIQMAMRHKESFLSTKTWAGVSQKIARSRRAWGE
jgi:uncharacterized protein (DUF169 family)